MKQWNKLLVFTVAFALVLTLAFGIAGILSFGDTYIEIDSAEELRKIGVDANYPLNGNYKLTADIDLSDAEWYGIGYNPTTQAVTAFTGSIDGQGHIISGMYYGTPSTAKAMVATSWGLVCAANAADTTVSIKNIIFEKK